MKCVRLITSLVALGMAVTAPHPGFGATDCKLSVSASDTTLMPGELAEFDVWAHFPATAYAFASADFEVSASSAGWSAVSSGVVAGADVNNISASQLHQPFAGIFADPANPLEIWRGIYRPLSYEPRYVTIKAVPSAFSYYPSMLT